MCHYRGLQITLVVLNVLILVGFLFLFLSNVTFISVVWHLPGGIWRLWSIFDTKIFPRG